MVSEQMILNAPVARVFEAVASARFSRWSPECFGVWVWRRRDGRPARFVGWNRRGPFLWFTTCTVVAYRENEEFAFDVTTFGMPVARWNYRFAPEGDGTLVVEEWKDLRGRGAWTMGRIFSGKSVGDRPAINREGMRETLRRLKEDLES